jgi:hypothetical protein
LTQEERLTLYDRYSAFKITGTPVDRSFAWGLCGINTPKRVYDKMQDTSTLADRPRKGRPTVFTKRMDTKLVNTIRSNRKASWKKLSKATGVSASTTGRRKKASIEHFN